MGAFLWMQDIFIEEMIRKKCHTLVISYVSAQQSVSYNLSFNMTRHYCQCLRHKRHKIMRNDPLLNSDLCCNVKEHSEYCRGWSLGTICVYIYDTVSELLRMKKHPRGRSAPSERILEILRRTVIGRTTFTTVLRPAAKTTVNRGRRAAGWWTISRDEHSCRNLCQQKPLPCWSVHEQ